MESFVSKRDRIIASAIDIICESGLSSLTMKSLSARENMDDGTLYKFFADIDEVLNEVVSQYARYDKMIRSTIKNKQGTYIEKLRAYLDAYATYYENYYAISILMLHYEEFLHMTSTRDVISLCVSERLDFVGGLLQEAMNAGEIKKVMSPEGLAMDLTGILMSHTFNRRIVNHKQSFKEELLGNLDAIIDLLTIKD